MASKKIIERLQQKNWVIRCETEHELALVLNACLDAGLHWFSGDKTSFVPEELILDKTSVFIAKCAMYDTSGFSDKASIGWGNRFEYFQTYNVDYCEDITDWFFEELSE